MAEPRHIIIGDLHGCYEEAVELIKQCDYVRGKDFLYFAGDLINRGPDSAGCWQLYKETNARAVVGNHEYEIIMTEKGIWQESRRIRKLKSQMGEALFREMAEDIKQWPYWIEGQDFYLVHAGVESGKLPAECDEETLTSIRYINYPDGRRSAWYEFYKGQKPIVFGHWSMLGGIHTPHVIGIDMGCVYGKSLRAVIFPGREIVEVQAKRPYYNPVIKEEL